MDISIVVPLYNEEENAQTLYQQLKEVLEKENKSYEIILVDDGSSDKTPDILCKLHENDNKLIIIRLRRNFGQTPALAAGIDYARGDIIITMDGDLQHDPYEIPQFLKKMEEGYDIVSGWRKNRVDNLFYRRIPSLVANRIMSILSDMPLHDFGTTYKSYKKEIIKNIELHGELHRFIPALSKTLGARVAEIPIKNIVRGKGKSNYGLSRVIRVFFDLLLVKYLVSYSNNPLKFFGLLGMFFLLVGAGIEGALIIKKLIYLETSLMVDHGPLFMISILFIIFGVQSITFGLLGEMLSRTYHSARGSKIYSTEKVLDNYEN